MLVSTTNEKQGTGTQKWWERKLNGDEKSF